MTISKIYLASVPFGFFAYLTGLIFLQHAFETCSLINESTLS